MPFADTMIAKLIDKRINYLKGEKSQREIATEIGYDKPNMISMFKRGEAKIPLDKIPALAKALDVDPMHMFRLALLQYWPAMNDMVEKMFGNVATANEEKILLRRWRKMTKNLDPKSTPEIELAVQEMLEKIKPTLL